MPDWLLIFVGLLIVSFILGSIVELIDYLSSCNCPACRQSRALKATGRAERHFSTYDPRRDDREYKCKYCGHLCWRKFPFGRARARRE